MVLLILIAALVLMAGAVREEFAPPRIADVPVPGDDPLTLRFAVANRGLLTTIADVDFTCVPDLVKGRDANGAPVRVHGAAFPMNVGIDLMPRASYQYTCPILGPIQGPHLPARVDHIEAHVEMRYTRFGRRADAQSAELVWDSQSKIWMAAGS